MREKLLDLLKSEGLKPSQFAEMLEINPAGVSHILAGRNKPGFDLLQKILRRFPQINPDWLLLDSTKMYREESGTVSGTFHPDEKTLPVQGFGQAGSGSLFEQDSSRQSNSATAQTRPSADRNLGDVMAGISSANTQEERRDGKNTTAPEIERVVIIYKDRTFESFTPKAEKF